MGDTPQVIVFTFAGRRGNMALQIPLMERILAENPNTQYHIWNLARVRSDGKYLKSLEPSSPQMKILHDYYAIRPWRDNLGKVWEHYTDKRYKNTLFVKLDDDIVFLETSRFPEYVAAIAANPGRLVSASVVNNGACTRTEPELFERYSPRSLLDAHSYKAFAEMWHKHFFAHWDDMINAPVSVTPTTDWLSINAIGMDHATLCDLTGRLGTPSPKNISGRAFPAGSMLGDEGAANMLPRSIMRGFVVAHLAFGPQLITEQLLGHWRFMYGKIGRQYLDDFTGGEVAV